MNIKCSYLPLLVLILSCSNPSHEAPTNSHGLSDPGKQANIDKAKTYDLISVEIGTSLKNILVSEHHLHGKFFDERAEFYVIENPELYISDTEVQELTLYFIDSTLCKKKYTLSKDISTELMKSYGGFKFLPLNKRTRELTKSEQIIFKTEEGAILNEKLDRFQMKWEDQEVLIKYNYSRDSLATEIYLEEELDAYKHLLAMAEYSGIHQSLSGK